VAEADVSTCIDTHVHLDDAAFEQDREEVLAASRAAGVRQFINFGYVPASWAASAELRERHPEVAIVIGLHPGHADLWNDALAADLEQSVQRLKPLAIGETGLDFVRPAPDPAQQVHAFRAQLALAEQTGLPVVIHQRQAAEPLMTELEQAHGVPDVVLHSFDGDARFVDWARDRDCYIGIGGLAAKKSSESLRSVLRGVPHERLLLETDSPYLAPPGAKSRRNTPANLPLIAELLAPIWGLSAHDLMRLTQANTLSLFGTWGEIA
jgi:TatD DNase family protein